MESIHFEDRDKQFLISIDKDAIDQETLIALLTKIRTESLSKKADFGDDIVQLGEEIKSDWWKRHKDQWIKKES